MKNLSTVLLLALSLTACKYSNTFEGTYNGNPAKLSAYSKNINRYCVALNLTAGSETKSTFISAQDVFDVNDFLKPKAFNTKDANCGSSNEEYLVGNRSTSIIDTTMVSEIRSVNIDFCQQVTYKRYEYNESVTFEFKNKATDQTTGIFNGTGMIGFYVDRDHPVAFGPVYFCGNNYPYPGPRPGPYPGPYPGPRPWPYPGYPYPF